MTKLASLENRRKHIPRSPPSPSPSCLNAPAFCTRRLEFVDDRACLVCFLGHEQLQMAHRLRTHCVNAHLAAHSQDETLISAPQTRSHPMDTPTFRRASTTPRSAQEWAVLVDIARTVARSGFLPQSLSTPEKAAAIILKGHELGIPAMQSVAHIHAIDGKLTCSSELMLALLARGGITWAWTQDGTDAQEAAIEFRRDGFEPVTGRFTMDDAQRIETLSWENGERKRVKLAEKEAWRNYPANLLRARAIANGARMIGPDLLTGLSYTPEELGAAVDEEGTPCRSQTHNGGGEIEDPTPVVVRPYLRFLRRCRQLEEQLSPPTFGEILSRFGLNQPVEVDEDDTATMKGVVMALEATLTEDVEITATEPMLADVAA
jgi:hypothetical protein